MLCVYLAINIKSEASTQVYTKTNSYNKGNDFIDWLLPLFY